MYKIKYTRNVIKELKKLDKQTAKIIKVWIEKNLIGTVDPRIYGKPLKGKLNGTWRYRIGDYRLFVKIADNELIIFILDVFHRRDAYKQQRPTEHT